ncbi:MAG: hypothetical protein JKY54_13910, partial [Flavobacteriales bacterium]|nr:hypothetical protein [Flavobacteriales bacterium]
MKYFIVLLFPVSAALMSFMAEDTGFKNSDFADEPGADTLYYLFMGHTYNAKPTGPRVDPRLVLLDKSGYSRLWLGGDICSEAFLEKSTVEHMDDVFDLGNPSTQYALGNHDVRNGNMQW